MPIERVDHHKGIFKGFPEKPEEEARRKAELPLVGPGLIEHLEAKFPRMPPQMASSQDQAVWVSTSQARERGHADVIDYLKSLLNKGEPA